MKLYATITSERASKGQGGKTLDIVIRNEKEVAAIAIQVDTDIMGRVRASVFYDMRYSHPVLVASNFLEEKGEKQKGNGWCEFCKMDTDMENPGVCMVCGNRKI